MSSVGNNLGCRRCFAGVRKIATVCTVFSLVSLVTQNPALAANEAILDRLSRLKGDQDALEVAAPSAQRARRILVRLLTK
jgi:hypothetical protein